MSIFSTVTEIFSVEYWRALEGSSKVGKGKGLDTCYSATYVSQDSWPAALYPCI